MRAVDVIIKKRDGGTLSRAELDYFVNGFVAGTVKEEQMAAFLMAVYYKGMTKREISDLTDIMQHSGDEIRFTDLARPSCDKHSTGGVGDKTTLVTAPIAAAAGVPVGKLSGRGLGFTGGTIDKLEAIPGFQTALSTEAFFRQVKEIGIALAGQTANLVPADKKMYALRDVTGTVESIPLIASSIMSKKLAAGAGQIVLDVKFGSGAFMEDPARAEELAKTMVEIGTGLDHPTVAVLSSMEEPLGYAVGNALEVQEAIRTLNGHGPEDLTVLSVTLAGLMIYLNGLSESIEEGKRKAAALLEDGSAWRKFQELVNAQGGHLNASMPVSDHVYKVTAKRAGFVERIEAKAVGHASMLLGAGRETRDSLIDPAAGVELRKKIGDRVEEGETLALLYCNDAGKERAKEAAGELLDAYTIGNEEGIRPVLIRKIITGDDL